MPKLSVVASNVTKQFEVRDKVVGGNFITRLKPGKKKIFTALDNVSFEAYQGDAIGVIGTNGSGKSTLMSIITGLVKPTSGRIVTVGETSLLAVGVGLNGFLTGRENIKYKCLILGYDKTQVEEITRQSIEFADVGDFIDRPLRTWSSGMRMRLGFAVSTFLDPDILVIDEALAVGDAVFADKCRDKIWEFRQAHKTIFIVSHSTSGIKRFCDKTMWLNKGKLVDYGETDKVFEGYNSFIASQRKKG